MKNNLKKIVSVLNNLNVGIDDCRRQILNYPYVIKYLFYKPINHYNDLVKAIQSCYDYQLINIKLDDVQTVEKTMVYFFMTHQKRIEDYEQYYTSFVNALATYSKNKEAITDLVVFKPALSIMVDDISEILDDLNISHTKYWSFMLTDPYANANKIKPYCYKSRLAVDIFGFVKNTKKNVLIYFAIVVGSNKLAVSDYLKQYNLGQISVCYLRLANYKNLKSQITKFIKMVKLGKEYVSICDLPIGRLGRHSNNDNTKAKLDCFYGDYFYNHKIYVENYNKTGDDEDKIMVELDDDNNKSEEDNGQILLDSPPDKSYILSDKIDFSKIKHVFTK